MNLYCNELDLWQTPTHITYMCMEADDPVTRLRMYSHWVASQSNGVWTEDQMAEYNALRANIKAHIAEINDLIATTPARKIEVHMV